MKTTNGIALILLSGVLALAGCGKSKPAAGPMISGVTVEVAKLQQAFATASPDLQTAVDAVKMGVRYGDYAATLAELDKLANNPSLTEAQKKIVAEVAEQVKQVASKAAPPPTQ
jgi:hypothetical protein